MKRLVVGGAVLALGIGTIGLAAAEQPAESGFKVTGGGQIIAQNAQGAGDTVGFNAQEINGDDPRSRGDNDDAARGQFQYVPRGQSSRTNQPATEKFHGVVTCLISGGEAADNERRENDGNYEEELSEGMARFGGYVRGSERDGSPQYFTLDVTDNGQGGNAEDDLILVRFTEEPCADNPENEQRHNPEDLLRLGRGNVKIHNNPDGQSSPMANARAARAMTAAVS